MRHHRAAGLLSSTAFCIACLMPLDAAAQLNSSSFSFAGWRNSGGNYTYAFAVGDVNHDGFGDVVATNQCYDGICSTDRHTGISVFLNDGSGTLAPPVRYKTDGFGASWQSVAIADLDVDGKPDLVVLNAGWSASPSDVSVSVMRGNGDGTFQPAVSYALNIYPNTQISPGKLTVADLNGDGKPDVIVSDLVNRPALNYPNNLRGGVSVLLNHGDGSLATAVLYDSGGYDGSANVIAADVNRDGSLDIVVLDVCSEAGPPTDPCRSPSGVWAQGTVGVLLGNGDGTLQQAITYDSGGITPGSLAAVDLNRDGKLDLLVTNGACFQCTGHAATVLMGNGNGSFQPPIDYNDGATQPVSITGGDVDGDGRVDVAVLNYCTVNLGCDGSTGILSVLPGNGDGTLGTPQLYNLWSTALGSIPNTVVLADMNNDGKPDVVIGAWTAVGVLLNQTPRAVTTTTLVSQPNPSAPGHPVTLSATVSSVAPGSPTGTITFTEGATVLGTAPLVNAVATLAVSSLSPGIHTIVASYSSDNAFRASVSAALSHTVLAATPTISLKVNGQHPAPPVVTTSGPMTLTLDVGPSAYSASLSWYWALIVNNQVFYVTPTGLKTTPAPLAVAPPVALANATLLNITLPPATTVTSVFAFVDGGGSLVAFDAVAATRP